MVTFNLSSEFLIGAYLTIHVLYGLVTHYHSVLEVRKFNTEERKKWEKEKEKKKEEWQLSSYSRKRQISSCTVFAYFLGRIIFGLPWLIVRTIVSPIGNRWHDSADQMELSGFN